MTTKWRCWCSPAAVPATHLLVWSMLPISDPKNPPSDAAASSSPPPPPPPPSLLQNLISLLYAGRGRGGVGTSEVLLHAEEYETAAAAAAVPVSGGTRQMEKANGGSRPKILKYDNTTVKNSVLYCTVPYCTVPYACMIHWSE